MWNEFYVYITDVQLWITIGQGLLKIILILFVANMFIRLGRLAISKVFLFRGKSPLRISERRENTLSKLLENILTYVIYFIMIIMVLETLTINVGALLAGAGIIGLAVGFGAQNLVKDIITGFFIIFEDQFSVGDFIRVSTFEGTVEEIGLRTTKIKSWTGELHILPNGSITEVTNYSIHNSIAVVDISISYESDIPEAERVIQELLSEIPDKYEDIVTPPELLGVQTLGASEVVLRVICEVEPMRHFHISRMLRKDIKICLDEMGIEIPYPRIVMYNRKEEVS
ncbi:mechanosensitive ion channel family protein [Metabacillus litoralis]|uniref:Mechanosensitive ion channel family protein n=1 Tax=Metabacillus litoralis TaxID=152268 RepID=A0A5C6VWV4_9BACI|nr:mechanosensitive ion channel family protein [Metabacillus litoralis]TXC89419.1 mechanosensitive ion channel family protein [Metabacillus litoralis]